MDGQPGACSCCQSAQGYPWLEGHCTLCHAHCVLLQEPLEGRFERFFYQLAQDTRHHFHRRLEEDGFCPHLNQSEESRARSLRLLEESHELDERFKALAK